MVNFNVIIGISLICNNYFFAITNFIYLYKYKYRKLDVKFNTVRMSSNKVFFPTKDFNMCVMVPILDGNSEHAAQVLRQSAFFLQI